MTSITGINFKAFNFSTAYKQYKDEDNYVVGWLGQTARKCGWPNDCEGLQPVLEPPATPKSLDQVYTLKTKDYTSLAQNIVDCKPAIEIPRSVIRCLQSVIKVRKDFAAWYTNNACSDESEKSNEQHQYRIQVLQEVLQIFLKSSNVSTQANASPSTGNLGLDSLNSFKDLKVDEIDSDSDGLPPPEVIISKKERVKTTYKPEPTEKDILFQIHCFFSDLDRIRKYCQDLWKGYQNGSIDLVTASVTTDTAFALMEETENQFKKTFSHAAGQQDYESLSDQLFNSVCKSRGEDPKFREQPDDPFNVRMSDSADWICMPAYRHLYRYGYRIATSGTPAEERIKIARFPPQIEWHQLDSRMRMHYDFTLLTDLLQYCLYGDPSTAFGGSTYLNAMYRAEDNVTRGWRNFCFEWIKNRNPRGKPFKTPKPAVWLVFGTQIFLDIHHLLGKNTAKGLRELKTSAIFGRSSLTAYQSYAKENLCGYWEPSSKMQHDGEVAQNLQDIQLECLTDKYGQALRHMQGAAAIMPDWFFLSNHPLVCGLMTFRLNVWLADSGRTCADEWQSIIRVAHLSNACKQTGYQKLDWPDMETILSIHGEKNVFAGTPPTKEEDFFKRLGLCCGMSIIQFASDKRRAVYKRRNLATGKLGAGKRSLGFTWDVSLLFIDRYMYWDTNSDRKLEVTLEAVQSMLNSQHARNLKLQKRSPSQASQSITKKDRDASKIAERFFKTKKLKPTQLLDALCSGLSAERPALTFDYFSMQMRCLSILRSIQRSSPDIYWKMIHEDRKIPEGTLGPKDADDMLINIPELIFHAVEIDAMAKKGRFSDRPLNYAHMFVPAQDSTSKPDWLMLIRQAGKVLDEVIQKEGDREVRKMELLSR